MAPSKSDLRAAALARRAAVPQAERDAFARRLAALGPRLVHEFAPRNAGLAVALFSAVGDEPSLTPLAEALAEAGVPLALPAVLGRGQALQFRAWTPGDRTAPGAFGIAEPLAEAPLREPDVLFVPLAAFDRRGHRVGYGAGFYDRSLQALRARKAVRAIGVAYAAQEQLYIPTQAHDEPLDLVVTERDVLLIEA